MKLFKNSLVILLIGLLSSLCPFGYLGLIFGSPAVVVSTILVAIIFRKELS